MSRLLRYAEVLDRAGADAFVLTSEAAVLHASGVRLYTQRLIPQRPVACVLAPHAKPALVVCVLEEEQLASEHGELEVRTYQEFGDDPWAAVADLLPARARVVVEDTTPSAWSQALRARLPDGEMIVSYDLPVEPRVVKDSVEQETFAVASAAAERALRAGAERIAPGISERDVAECIVSHVRAELAERSGELIGMCIGPQNNRSMHHTAGPDLLPPQGPVRLGVVGRVDGYWILLTRMALLGADLPVERAYARYHEAYKETLSRLRVGSRSRDIYAACRDQVAKLGFELTTLKVGHGTGLDFREPPFISPFDDRPLEDGMVLAYDYGLEAENVVIHVEDRVLVTPTGPERLSGAWDLSDLATGWRAVT
jgi:Xaa-Pro dipeptidase